MSPRVDYNGHKHDIANNDCNDHDQNHVHRTDRDSDWKTDLRNAVRELHRQLFDSE